MSRTATPTPLRPAQYQLTLPELHPGQWEVANNPARFKVVCCGRQWGKTTLGAELVIAEAARGGNAWWVAPSFPIGIRAWREILRMTEDLPVSRRGHPFYRLGFPNGGSIELRSADTPDSLRGATLNAVVFDEAAQAKPDAWPTLRPTLDVRGGWAMFISTPKGLNWFHDLYEQAGVRPAWNRWRFPSVQSPYLSERAAQDARQEMSSLLFSQEYEADFVSGSLGVFHADWIYHYFTHFEGDERVYMLGDEAVSEGSCRKLHTVDLAWSQAETADYTVISTWAVTPKSHLLLIDCIRGRFEGPDIVPKMRQVYERHGGVLIVEKATRQMSIIQEAVRSGLPVREVRAEKDKIARAQAATARMENGRIWFPPASTPWWPELEEEILAFPAGRHDDFVDTLAYAVREVGGSGSRYLANLK